jgi:hypothetical protein
MTALGGLGAFRRDGISWIITVPKTAKQHCAIAS